MPPRKLAAASSSEDISAASTSDTVTTSLVTTSVLDRDKKKEESILTRKQLQDFFANNIDKHQKLDADVEDLLIEFVDEFVKDATGFACKVAKRRNGSTLELADLQLPLKMKWGLDIPGADGEPATDADEESATAVTTSATIPTSSSSATAIGMRPIRLPHTRAHDAKAAAVRASIAGTSTTTAISKRVA